MAALCFGGSFNPIHHGHLICARAAAEAAGFRKIVLIPSAIPPHKQAGREMAAKADRLAMSRLAVAESPLFETSEIELHREGPSYTIDTARALAPSYGKVHWLIGGDMLMYLPHWHEAERLIEEVDFVVMARPGWTMDWEILPIPFRRLKANVVATPLVDIRASEIRRRVAAGLPIDYFTPAPVVEYIRDKGLYRA